MLCWGLIRFKKEFAFVAVLLQIDRFISLSIRNHFSNKNGMETIKEKEETISFVKCVGRMHDLLTGIMDKINYCYSFQVF